MSPDDVIYLDNHASTRCDPRVVEAMIPMLSEHYGNAHSTHRSGRAAAEDAQRAIDGIARDLGCVSDELIMTSGATESNNLALIGYCTNPRQKRRHVITVTTEHPSVLDPAAHLERTGFRVTRLVPRQQGDPEVGRVDLDELTAAIDTDTAIVSIMMANNEIGVLQDVARIASVCADRGVAVHTDATQGVGKVPVDVVRMGVDLLSASAHKFYGPKGVGLLYVRRRGKRIRLRPILEGGGQQGGLRSGTLNTAGIVGMAVALELCTREMAGERDRIDALAGELWKRLREAIPGVRLNGPPREPDLRLEGNLNVCFPLVEGDSLLSAVPRLALSSGAACSSMDPGPSHVLRGIGLNESAARRSLRFGLGRFNTADEIATAADLLVAAHTRLAKVLE